MLYSFINSFIHLDIHSFIHIILSSIIFGVKIKYIFCSVLLVLSLLQADYLTLQHNTGLDLKDEFILIGRDTKNGHKNFSVHSLKLEDEYRKKRVAVHEISYNIFVASTQFERPFDYSTSSWVRDNDCNKNVSKLKMQQKHYGNEFQPVSVMKQSAGDGFAYFLKSIANPPTIRITVPGELLFSFGLGYL